MAFRTGALTARTPGDDGGGPGVVRPDSAPGDDGDGGLSPAPAGGSGCRGLAGVWPAETRPAGVRPTEVPLQLDEGLLPGDPVAGVFVFVFVVFVFGPGFGALSSSGISRTSPVGVTAVREGRGAPPAGPVAV
ncbi:hypothetical protein [Streptomyces cellulosae]|uniref:hypothetical protein n=1 Tax=Streptomyces cellulosae TaxID=1968 RepID=UPI001F34B26F|nr:hypothetical protein [Streptomyces cellulosae]